MTFSKAIQIKHLVNLWNKDRSEGDFGFIAFGCVMFSLGHWSVEIKPMGNKLFFSQEMTQLITLHAGGGFIMFVSSRNDHPIIYMQ